VPAAETGPPRPTRYVFERARAASAFYSFGMSQRLHLFVSLIVIVCAPRFFLPVVIFLCYLAPRLRHIAASRRACTLSFQPVFIVDRVARPLQTERPCNMCAKLSGSGAGSRCRVGVPPAACAGLVHVQSLSMCFVLRVLQLRAMVRVLGSCGWQRLIPRLTRTDSKLINGDIAEECADTRRTPRSSCAWNRSGLRRPDVG
jgi:hypothetical protein